jgi:hypothetical protein
MRLAVVGFKTQYRDGACASPSVTIAQRTAVARYYNFLHLPVPKIQRRKTLSRQSES